MSHNHTHAHAVESASADNLKGIYIFSIALNLLFVFIEAGIGLWSGSLGLLSDAGHNLSDVFSLILALIAFRLSYSAATKRFTYGYRKSSILISLLNAIILLVAVGAILAESIHKLRNIGDFAVNGNAITWTAAAGIIVNGLTAWLLMKRQKHDINTRGAYLHMLADTLVSVGVVISGIIISLTGWYVIDPLVSIVIAAVILVSTWSLLSESLKMSIDAVPENVDIIEIENIIEHSEGVSGLHHLHIWPISTTQTALTAHVLIEDKDRMEEIVHELKHELKEHGISHSTIEIETSLSECEDKDCSCADDPEALTHHHHHHHH